MGVTYKFKQEVVDFILQQKKATPSVSCRRLTTIVREHFHMDVSKSAVNSVLKSNRLSSPVGRHPKSKVLKNFYIPQEKKDELRANLSALLSSVIDNPQTAFSKDKSHSIDNHISDQIEPFEKGMISDSNKVEPPEENIKKTDVINIEPSIEGISKNKDSENIITHDSHSHLLTDFDRSTSISKTVDAPELIKGDFHKVRKRTLWEDKDAVEHEQALAIFWVAQLWEMDNKHLLGKKLAQIIKDLGKHISVDIIEGALILIQKEKEIPSDIKAAVLTSVAEIMGVDSAELNDTYKEITNILSTNLQASLFFESAWETLSTQAACFELVTREGHKLYVDSLWTQISTEPILESSRCMFLYHAITRLALEFINNIDILEINVFNKDSFFDSFFFHSFPLIVGLERDYIDTVSILSLTGDKLASFTRLPKITRGFIISGTLFDSDFGRIDFDKIGEMDNFYSPVDGCYCIYHEGKVKVGEDFIFNAKLIMREKKEQKYISISNLKESNDFCFNFFDVNKTIDDTRINFLLNKKFIRIIKRNNFFTKIKEINLNSYPGLENQLFLINRKKIVNANGQKLSVVCHME